MSRALLWRGLLRALAGRRLPTTGGALRIDGLWQGVSIRRDRFGVPYIEARNDTDAWFAVGFCQGQDRTLAWTAADIDAATVERLALEPAAESAP